MANKQAGSAGYESFQIEDGADESLISKSITSSSANSSGSTFWGRIMDRFSGHSQVTQPSNNVLHSRKVPVKVEPKVFFANERTFLAWLHMAMTLASISVGIVAFSGNSLSAKRYGLILMPVAISFCVYALWVYIKVSFEVNTNCPMN